MVIVIIRRNNRNSNNAGTITTTRIWVLFTFFISYKIIREILSLEVDVPVTRKCNKPAVERILEFGKELYSMSQKLDIEQGASERNQKMLEVSIFFDIPLQLL